ncbi:MAG: sigma-70 family RNA polymerase sigma factor [candidate division Zixibacteria bacterium]
MEESNNKSVTNTEQSTEDAAYIIRARNGDKASYGYLVKKYQKRVLRMVIGMVGDLDNAMDIVQDSFIRGWQALDRFDETRPFYPWLSTIATNQALNFLKRSGRQTSLEPSHNIRLDAGPDPLEKLQLIENDRRFLKAVRELPGQYQIVFILRHFEELSYDEIAKRLEISQGTVDSRLYRARKALVEKLKDLLE